MSSDFCSNYRSKLHFRKIEIDIMSAEPGPEASGSASGSASGKVGEGFHLVSSLSELKKSGRKRLAVGDRMVVVFHVAGQLYALDYFCYRERKSLVACLQTLWDLLGWAWSLSHVTTLLIYSYTDSVTVSVIQMQVDHLSKETLRYSLLVVSYPYQWPGNRAVYTHPL